MVTPNQYQTQGGTDATATSAPQTNTSNSAGSSQGAIQVGGTTASSAASMSGQGSSGGGSGGSGGGGGGGGGALAISSAMGPLIASGGNSGSIANGSEGGYDLGLIEFGPISVGAAGSNQVVTNTPSATAALSAGNGLSDTDWILIALSAAGLLFTLYIGTRHKA